MKWRVYNMHPQGFTHKEKFRDELLQIKAGEYILMDYEDAVLFRGQYFPMTMDAGGQQDPKSYKVIKIEPDDKSAQTDVKKVYVCHVDGKEFPTPQELEAYVQAKYGDLEPFIDESIEAELDKSEPTRRRPGRPPKEKTL